MRVKHLVLLLVLALVGSPLLSAQERFGGLTGTVVDASKLAVPGATVTITNKQTGASRSAVTGTDGTFMVPDLEPGRYSVTIELQGFQKVTIDDVLVLLGKTFPVSAELKPGAVTEVVNVTAGAEKQIDLKSVTLAHNVTAEELDRIPKGRTFQGVAMLAPGVNSGDIEAGFVVHGASGAENSYLVDGVPTNSLIDGRTRENTVF
ncbi:MAG TPA: carboxypeptidase regulatory-like domain-containing protein, partial [Vicinamibacterales bacterium]|nr:carboxypeptidase regulatory-like domain-containing protein [Vicinamibacterales bacterium]